MPLHRFAVKRTTIGLGLFALQLLDHDAYYWFKEHGGMTRDNGQRFRDVVLSRGGTQDAAVMYRAFRGRDPIVEPLLIERGLKSAKE